MTDLDRIAAQLAADHGLTPEIARQIIEIVDEAIGEPATLDETMWRVDDVDRPAGTPAAVLVPAAARLLGYST